MLEFPYVFLGHMLEVLLNPQLVKLCSYVACSFCEAVYAMGRIMTQTSGSIK